MPPRPTACVLLIGNELLSGKIRDSNGYFLTRWLRRQGIQLREIAIVADDIHEIGAALLRLVARAPLVFTSGGVGPTHDDCTLAAVAHATGRAMIRNVDMEQALRRHYGDRTTAAVLSMADLPAGTVPCALPGWPVLRLDLEVPAPARVYMLPGVPELLQAKLERLETLPGELPRMPPWALSHLDVECEEGSLADLINRVVAAFPMVEIGSYPRWQPDEQGQLRPRVHITFEAPQEHRAKVDEARAALRAELPAAVILE